MSKTKYMELIPIYRPQQTELGLPTLTFFELRSVMGDYISKLFEQGYPSIWEEVKLFSRLETKLTLKKLVNYWEYLREVYPELPVIVFGSIYTDLGGNSE